MTELVVLLHGIWRTSRCMRLMQKALEVNGYSVLNLDYPSRSAAIEPLADNIWQSLEPKLAQYEKLHIIGFSMGGLIARVMLAKHEPPNLGNVVLIGTPNQGAELASFLSRFRLFGRLYGPAGLQLAVEQIAQLEWLKRPVQYPLGVIAGNLSIYPHSRLLVPLPNDGTVSVESTRVEGMSDHITVRGLHSFLPYSPTAIRQAVYFLRHQTFER